jgi:hypothetical protein
MIKDFAFAAFVLFLSIACSDEDKLPKGEVDPPGAPPRTWKPDDRELTRVFYDDDVAIYYDDLIDPSVAWTHKFVGDTWRYIKDYYQCTPDLRLYAVFYGDGGGGTVGYYYSDSFDYNNTIITYSDNMAGEGDLIKDVILHEMFHVVETIAFGADSNSAGYGDYPNGIWGDSQFAPIFQYDIYRQFGMTRSANQWKNDMAGFNWDKPIPNTYWSRDWFLPIYEQYGEGAVLREFFKLVAEHFPDDRKLNFGEFIHFFSGAAGANLKELGQNAFGWNETFENEWNAAREEFPMLTYE